MEYLTLNNGLKMPVLGLGTWDLRGKQCIESVKEAIELGYRLIDTAQMYDNEKEIGQAISDSNVNRAELFITTKIFRPNNSYQATKKAIAVSLENLQLDYLDLLLIHEPYQESIEMYRAMKEAYDEGKVKAIGISNFSRARYADFVNRYGEIPALNQVEAHVFYQQRDLYELMEKTGTCMQAWSPFAAGKNNYFENPVLCELGQKYGKSAAQIGLRYLVQNGIGVIPKSARKERMIENLAIFDFTIAEDDLRLIQSLDNHKSLFGWYD